MVEKVITFVVITFVVDDFITFVVDFYFPKLNHYERFFS